ncbi:hypothetical protein [Micromonospora sp. M71_S20]|uniref:hypothetical protein n=1 Tax=Micromonospora sp. M71_S20 TaxID=592872 RepID=UPI001F40DF1D|nr:hypothetical protein [Micromonospora sp. M71_S20]
MDTEPGGDDIVRQPVPQVHQRGQQPINEPEPMLGSRSDPATACPRGEPVMVLCPPLRPQLADQALNHRAGQARQPTIRHDRSTHHGTNNDHRYSRIRNLARDR